MPTRARHVALPDENAATPVLGRRLASRHRRLRSSSSSGRPAYSTVGPRTDSLIDPLRTVAVSLSIISPPRTCRRFRRGPARPTPARLQPFSIGTLPCWRGQDLFLSRARPSTVYTSGVPHLRQHARGVMDRGVHDGVHLRHFHSGSVRIFTDAVAARHLLDVRTRRPRWTVLWETPMPAPSSGR